MKMAWIRMTALALLLWPVGCIISVGDDSDNSDGFAGDGGTYGSAGSSGRGGSAGTSTSSAGDAGEAGSAGTAGSAPIDVTCDEEAGDEADPCVQCLKQSCCDAWLGCNDETCSLEWDGTRECVAMEEFPDSDTLGTCISANAEDAEAGILQPNTQTLLECTLAAAGDGGFATRCSTECFGADIFFD